MTAAALKIVCHDFARAVSPYLQISDDKRYEEALELVESLLEDAHDSHDDPSNAVIEMLSRSIEDYENRDEDLLEFETTADELPADLAMLKVLMDQYDLGTADLPEIGSKSMVSRVLSGTRSLNKNHIRNLSKRFQVDPGLFF